MIAVASRASQEQQCSLCATPHTTHLESDRFSQVVDCQRHRVPIVALKRHTGSPTAGEWRHLELRAKRSFPKFRWQRPFSFNGHFYLHAVTLQGRCNLDHAAAA